MIGRSGRSFWPQLRRELRIPVIVAPMFLVSGPAMVAAACRAGVIGSFPTLNARTPEILDAWLGLLGEETKGAAPYAANLILHRSNTRRETDLDLVVRHRTPLVIASVGSPASVVERVHAYGGTVLADVASLRHARKAADAGADGLILLTAGAGGNTGWLNPFAFVSGVREFYSGPLAVAGCISHGRELRAIEMLGADIGYMGSTFLAAEESLAPREHKAAVIAADADDIVLTDAVSGLPANFIRSRLEEAGLLHPDGRIERAPGADDIFSWKSVWSAGQGVGVVKAQEPISAIVGRIEAEYLNAAPNKPAGQ